MQKIVGIAWAEHSNRLDTILKSLCGESLKISFLSGKKYLAPVRYLILGILTISKLIKLNPDIVIAQNPPVFCPLFVYFYSKFYKKKVIIDCHSLARYNYGILWKILACLELYLMRRAVVNLVIHEVYSIELDRLMIKNLVLYDLPPELDSKINVKDFRVIAPLGGHPDEDIESILKVADLVKDIEVIITGKCKVPIKHSRVKYLGFLPRKKYTYELLKAKAGLCILKKNEMTLPYVLFEFASISLPFVVSETLTTKVVGKIFLAKNVEEVAEKLEKMKDPMYYETLVNKVTKLRNTLQEKSKKGMEELRSIIKLGKK